MSHHDMKQNTIQQAAEDTGKDIATEAEKRPWLSLTAVLGVIFGLVGFYDPAKDLYKQFTDTAYQGVRSVELADYQKSLWVKNSTCTIKMTMKELAVEDDVTIRIGTCPSKDILVQVFPKSAPAFSNWVSGDINQIANKTALSHVSLMSAYAATIMSEGRSLVQPLTSNIQNSIATLCQGWADPSRQSKLVRVVNVNGKCFKEITNVYSGQIIFREEVPCQTSCQ